MTKRLENNIILAYSAKKNKANKNPEYSVLKPDTNSDSASGKSKGTRFNSAVIQIKNKIALQGENQQIHNTSDCQKIISRKLNERVYTETTKAFAPILKS